MERWNDFERTHMKHEAHERWAITAAGFEHIGVSAPPAPPAPTTEDGTPSQPL